MKVSRQRAVAESSRRAFRFPEVFFGQSTRRSSITGLPQGSERVTPVYACATYSEYTLPWGGTQTDRARSEAT